MTDPVTPVATAITVATAAVAVRVLRATQRGLRRMVIMR
jgi:hypothetical protein